MVGRDGRLERCKHENLPAGADLEYRAAAVADEQVANGIERDSGRRAHAFDPKLRTAVGCYAMHRTIVAAGNVEVTFAVQSKARLIHQLGDERLHRVIGCDLVQGDGDLLSALPAVGDVNVSLGVHRGVGNGVKIVGNLYAEMKRKGLTLCARCFHAHDAAHGAVRHTRDQMIVRRYQQARLGFAEAHERARVRAGHKSAAINRNVPAGNPRSRENAIDAWYAVSVQLQFSNLGSAKFTSDLEISHALGPLL